MVSVPISIRPTPWPAIHRKRFAVGVAINAAGAALLLAQLL